MNNELLLDELKQASLAFVPDYLDYKSLLCIPIKELDKNSKPSWKMAFNGIKEMLIKSGYPKARIKHTNSVNSKVLCFYGSYWYRNDHHSTFANFTNYFKNADIYCAELVKHRVSIPNCIKAFFRVLIWSFQVFSNLKLLRWIFYFSPYLNSSCDILDFSKSLDIKRYNLLLVYSDLSPDENTLVQIFNNQNVHTATLQHGIFSELIQFKYSPSQSFLLWNQYTKNMLKEKAIDSDKFIVLGIPKYIGIMPRINSVTNNTFGVVLNVYSPIFEAENKRLIECANEIAEKLQMKYVLRYHPSMSDDRYIHICGKHYQGNDTSPTILEYASKVSFTILSSSSAYIELVYLKHTTFRLDTGPNNFYSKCQNNCFHDIISFCNEYTKEVENNNLGADKLFKNLCTTNNIYENYYNFLSNYLES